MKEAIEKAGRIPTTLDKRSGTSVFLFFIESYGHTVFDEPRHFSMIESLMREFELDLKVNGFGAYSNFLTYPPMAEPQGLPMEHSPVGSI